MKKLAIISTHPIQYYAPVFKLLQAEESLVIKVFYTWGEEAQVKFDQGFGQAIQWDLPLLEGYSYEWVQNTATNKGSHHFRGIVNPQLITKIEAWQPDALLIYGWANQSHLKVLRHFKNKTTVYFRGDSTLLGSQGRLKAFAKRILLGWVYSHVDFAFYVGTRNKSYFSRYGLQPNQLIFAPHAIDNSRFSINRNEEVKHLRESLNVSEDDILIVFAGKFEQKKNPLILFSSFLQLQKEQTPGQPGAAAHLLFVGNGALEETLKLSASSSTNVHFLDFQNQQTMPVIYQACDLFCLPSAGPAETWGLAVNEAMACSKAILVSDQVGCAVDLVKDGCNGHVFEAQSDTGLTGTLKILLSKGRGGLAEMGQNSKVIIDKWTFRQQVDAITAAILKYG